MRIFKNKASVYRRRGCDHIDVDLDSSGRMGTEEGEAARVAFVTRLGREVGAYLTEQERISLVKSLLRDGEWVIGFPYSE